MLNRQREWKPTALIVILFIGCYYVPLGSARFDNEVLETLRLAKWFAREIVLLCQVSALFIAGQ